MADFSKSIYCMSGVRSLSLTGCLRERPLVHDKMNTDGEAAPAPLTLMACRSPPSSPKQLVLEGEAGRRRRTQTGGENMSSVRSRPCRADAMEICRGLIIEVK